MNRWTIAAVAALSVFVSASTASAQGACCLTGAQCVPAADVAECSGLGGIFLPGEDCANAPCSTGACCDGQDCGQADAFSCISAGRTFAGAGTSCLDDPCDAGSGACCFTDGNCQDIGPDDCSQQGGTWLGAGTNCGQGVCTLGACCTINGCTNLAQYQCTAPDETFVAGGDCAVNPCNDCPPGTLFAQQRDDPDNFIAGTSEHSANLRRWENFTGVAGSIESVTWWGLDLDHIGGNNFVECDEIDPTFTINFHEDAGGVPGALVCSYKILATRTPTGILYKGAELHEYTATLNTPCVLVHGWISTVGLGDPECWFLWMSAGLGGESYCDNCVPSQQSFDLAICLVGTAGRVFGACCDDSTGTCTENVEITDCVGGSLRFAPNQACAALDPACGTILGACCLSGAACSAETNADCTVLGGNWLGAGTLCSSCPCVVECPPGGVAEGEPTCFPNYDDTFNGGCTSQTAMFSSITLGTTVCGSSGVFEVPGDIQPDLDWYEITLEVPTLLSWSVLAEFPAQIWIFDAADGCADLVAITTTDGNPCEPLSVSWPLDAGTYWLVLSPTTFADDAECGAAYTAIAVNECPQDLDGDGTVGINDFLALLAAWGMVDVPADFDGGGVGINDFLQLLAAWGPC